MTNPLRKLALAITALCAFAAPALAFAQEAPSDGGGFTWVVAPYLWAADVGADLNLRHPYPDGGNETNFGSVIDKIDGAFEVHVEGQGDHFGFFADYTFLGLEDRHQRRFAQTQSNLDTTLFEAAAVWNPSDTRFTGFDLFAGLRYLSTDLKVKIDPNDPLFNTNTFRGDKSYSDFMFGGRYTFKLSDKWGLTTRADGSWGQTDGTWNLSAIANYRFKHGIGFVGYRYLSIALKNDDHVIDIVTKGPILGYGFVF